MMPRTSHLLISAAVGLGFGIAGCSSNGSGGASGTSTAGSATAEKESAVWLPNSQSRLTTINRSTLLSVVQGQETDLLVFEGDPFEISSRLIKVVVNGELLDPDAD